MNEWEDDDCRTRVAYGMTAVVAGGKSITTS